MASCGPHRSRIAPASWVDQGPRGLVPNSVHRDGEWQILVGT
eukprot:CAMPEP_0175063778 /NCGR_PEP_ID=MMETSP0052_2-20121109/14952_1 /TAXON_ID=51329 ORGANISM="Polytomella parva, Strain SAG 63-3" /NCGR_SAMPLE_ID=MMETSP0052_2 /ASSEMBLY_ACC=CAM_ASM_000194 /LENGTH=41 /DNA_ID= /DNA_START= /DNA_END= /DNA_ORIENTATION=